MWCMQNFALIADGKIKDIVVCDDYNVANQIAQNVHGQGATAADVTHYALEVGDEYDNGKFYRDGKEIQPLPSVEDKLNELNAAAESLEEAACDLDGLYAQRLADIEEALCEISELINNRG